MFINNQNARKPPVTIGTEFGSSATSLIWDWSKILRSCFIHCRVIKEPNVFGAFLQCDYCDKKPIPTPSSGSWYSTHRDMFLTHTIDRVDGAYVDLWECVLFCFINLIFCRGS